MGTISWIVVILIILIIVGKFMGSSSKSDLAKRMIQGVDLIKITLFSLFKKNLSKSNSDDHSGKLAAAAINELYGVHVEKTQNVYNEYKDEIEAEFSNLKSEYPELIQPFTDSLRVFVQANQMLGSEKMNDVDETMKLFEKSIDRGLFNKGGDNPEPSTFISMAQEISNKFRS